jgi:FkbM family methyltransferase
VDSRDCLVTLKTPFADHAYLLAGSAKDRSIIGALQATAGVWEPYVMNVMKAFIAHDSVCLDIGANIGAMTLVMSGLASRGEVFAFEPCSRNATFLRENLIRNSASNVTVLQKALFDRTSQIELFYVDELGACSFLETGDRTGLEKIKAVVTQEWMQQVELHCDREKVECVRLDDWAAAMPLHRLDFIKLDAEGAETQVIQGGLQTIMRFQPKLVTEFNPACMIQYFDRQPQQYYALLTIIYPKLMLIESTAELSAIPNYEWLDRRIQTGKGWEDLLCSF